MIPSNKTLACYQNGSFYSAISAEAGTKHGLSSYLLVALHGGQDHIWSVINDVNGVDRVLVNNDKPSKATERYAPHAYRTAAHAYFLKFGSRLDLTRFGSS